MLNTFAGFVKTVDMVTHSVVFFFTDNPTLCIEKAVAFCQTFQVLVKFNPF